MRTSLSGRSRTRELKVPPCTRCGFSTSCPTSTKTGNHSSSLGPTFVTSDPGIAINPVTPALESCILRPDGTNRSRTEQSARVSTDTQGASALSGCRSFPFVTSWPWRSSSRWHRTITDEHSPWASTSITSTSAGDAPPRLLLRDSPWDPCGGRGQPPLPVRLLLAGRLLLRGTPLGDRRRRGLGCCTRPVHRTNGHPGRTLTGGASHEPWAILCRHPPVPEVAQHSVNPRLVGTITYSLEIGKDQFSAPISRNAARDRNCHCVRLASDEGPAGSLNRFAPGEA